MSFTSGSISTRFSQRGKTSPNPVRSKFTRGSRSAFLYASPNPAACQLKSTLDPPSYPKPQKVLGGRLSFEVAKPRNVNSNGLRGPSQARLFSEGWQLSVSS